MRTFVVAGVACVVVGSGCVDIGDDIIPGNDPAPGAITSYEPPDEPALELVEAPPSCIATLEPSGQATGFSPVPGCTARVEVTFACRVSPQLHAWARLGVLVDGALWAFEDATYACGDRRGRTFGVPCDAIAIVGGATFDHPVTGADVSCTAP